MSRHMRSIEELKKRGVQEVWHICTDHWEPGAWTKRERADVSQIHKLIEKCLPAKMSYFIKDPISVALKKDTLNRDDIIKHRLSTYDQTCVVQFDNEPTRLTSDAIKLLWEEKQDLHWHLHHEMWTTTTYPHAGLSEKRAEFHSYVCDKDNPYSDSERVKFKTELALGFIEDAIGQPLPPWAFTHGKWALAGSDPEVCQLEDEISILMKRGCFGDFSFPAGRRQVNPILTVPFTFNNIKARRPYDNLAADPRPVSETGLNKDRFFAWSAGSRVGSWNSSLDFYSPDSELRFRRAEDDPEYLADFVEFDLPVIDSVALLKTHSHSLHPHYWKDLNNPNPPLARAYDKFLGPMADACDSAGISWRWLSVRELMAKLRNLCPVRP